MSSRVKSRGNFEKRLIEDRDTILELTAKIQELQNEVDCINDLRDFKDAESVCSGLSHVTSQPALLPPFRDPGGMHLGETPAVLSLGKLYEDHGYTYHWNSGEKARELIAINPTMYHLWFLVCQRGLLQLHLHLLLHHVHQGMVLLSASKV